MKTKKKKSKSRKKKLWVSPFVGLYLWSLKELGIPITKAFLFDSLDWYYKPHCDHTEILVISPAFADKRKKIQAVLHKIKMKQALEKVAEAV